MNKNKIKKYRIHTPQSAEEAFDLVKPILEAMTTEDLIQINVDIPHAGAIALGAADRLELIADEILALPGFDRDALVNLRVYAFAAVYANALATRESIDDNVEALLEEAAPLREKLLVCAEALAYCGLFPQQRVAEIRSGQGHLDTAADLIALSPLYRDGWEHVKAKTAVTLEEVEHAAVLGSQLHAAIGGRRVAEGLPSRSPESILARDRTFARLVRAYDECRSAASYLRRHEGDVDEYAPSFYTKRKRRSASVEEPSPPALVEPVVVSNPQPEPTTPSA